MSSAITFGGAQPRGPIIVTAALAGALMGIGLLVSGMTDPARVIGFLSPASGWDPSLGFVMAGAVIVYTVVFHGVRRLRRTPLLDHVFHLPLRRDIDRELVVGAAIFGAGWGLAGFCPGPGLVAAASGSVAGLQFVVAMLVGMLAQHGWSRN